MSVALKLAEIEVELGNLKEEVRHVDFALQGIERCTVDARLKVEAIKERAIAIHIACGLARKMLAIQ
jgi:hypothetical protein